jgi:GntR family transcriptional regulator
MIVIDYQDRRPIYEQVVEKLETLILKGVLEADAQMPSVRQMAAELSINPNTIQKAYAILEQAGYVYTVKGRGSFVNGDMALRRRKREDCMEKLEECLRESREFGVSGEECLACLKRVYGEVER